MDYKLEIFDSKMNLIDVKIIRATGRRFAVLKYLRRFPNNVAVMDMRVTSTDRDIVCYRIQKLPENIIEINKTRGF